MSRLLYANNDLSKYDNYAKENVQITDTGVNRFKMHKPEYANEDSEDYNKLYTDAKFNNVMPRELQSLADEVKDKINMGETPENERDGVWIYYNGKVYSLYNPPNQEWWVSHNHLANAITSDSKLLAKIKGFRGESYEIPSKRTIKSVGALAFGHICAGKVAVIDLNAISNRVNSTIVKDALKQAGFTKIYIGDLVADEDFKDLKKLQRIAKRLMHKA